MTSRQRAHLRSLAHSLKPAVHIGKDGVKGPILRATEEALNTRELLKIRVLDAAPADPREVGHELAEKLDGVELVQVIGHVIVVYRPFPKEPEIRLPA